MVAFGVEFTCLAFGYLAYLLWNRVSITGSAFSDTLLLGFLSTLFALNYAIASRLSTTNAEENEMTDNTAHPGTKREQALKFLKVLGLSGAAAVAGDSLFIIANAQITKWAYGGPQEAPLSAFTPIVILRADIGERGRRLPCGATAPSTRE